ncbi:hypothetical protein K523DRAFT_135737, partial [Schizophyllum commune Tattone D]
PYAPLLAKLSGLEPKRRARSGVQQYQREQNDTLSDAYKDAWAEAVSTGKAESDGIATANFRQKIALKLFAELDQDVQTDYGDRAKAEAEEERAEFKRLMKEGPDTTPEFIQKCINNLPKFMSPILRGINEYTKLHATLIVGGPIPRHNGAIRVYNICVGKNLSDTPVSWGEQDAVAFQRDVCGSFGKYLKTAYTDAECAAVALDPSAFTSSGDAPKPPTTSRNAGEDSDASSEDDMGGLDESDSDGDIGGDGAPSKKKKKTTKPRKKKGKKNRRDAAEDEEEDELEESADDAPARKKSSKRRRAPSEEEASDDEDAAPKKTRKKRRNDSGDDGRSARKQKQTKRHRANVSDDEEPAAKKTKGSAASKAATERPTRKAAPATSASRSSASQAGNAASSGANSFKADGTWGPLSKRKLAGTGSIKKGRPLTAKRAGEASAPAAKSTETPASASRGAKGSADEPAPNDALTEEERREAEDDPRANDEEPTPTDKQAPVDELTEEERREAEDDPRANDKEPTPTDKQAPVDELTEEERREAEEDPHADDDEPAPTDKQTPVNELDEEERRGAEDNPRADEEPASLDGPAPVDEPTLDDSEHAHDNADADNACVCPDDAPDWMSNNFALLHQPQLGDKYCDLLRLWIALEKAKGFDINKKNKGMVGPTKKPAILQHWIQCGRAPRVKQNPLVKNVKAFEKDVWSWWSGLQPSWRKFDGDGRPSEDRDVDGDWGHLEVHGQNGFMSVVACLCWWGLSLKGKSNKSWERCVDDVAWVCEEVGNGFI